MLSNNPAAVPARSSHQLIHFRFNVNDLRSRSPHISTHMATFGPDESRIKVRAVFVGTLLCDLDARPRNSWASYYAAQRPHVDSSAIAGSLEIELLKWPRSIGGEVRVKNAHLRDAGHKVVVWNEAPIPPVLVAFERLPTDYIEVQLSIHWLKHYADDNGWIKFDELFFCRNINDTSETHAVAPTPTNHPNVKIVCNDGYSLHLIGKYVTECSQLLNQYCEGRYGEQMSIRSDGAFQCDEFDSVTLRVLFCFAERKKVVYDRFRECYFDVMKAADFFGVKCMDEVFALEAQRRLFKGDTYDVHIVGTRQPGMTATEYLELLRAAKQYNIRPVAAMVMPFLKVFFDALKRNDEQYKELCDLLVG